MHLYPRKGGHGHVTLYLCPVGSGEAKRLGFVTEDGQPVELEKLVDEENGQLIVRVKRDEAE